MDKIKKDVIFKFRLTAEELATIKRKAQSQNISTSEYIRRVAIK